ncbi:CLN3 protein-domain-containing protein [Pisolithus marmoratus]|nr:CLN3 protein-domain-containing protein [Pisolithus marmoratus]
MAIDTEQADSERYQIGGISNSRKGRGSRPPWRRLSVVVPTDRKTHLQRSFPVLSCIKCSWFLCITGERRLLFKLGLSFFVLGLINNALYVIILSAALDLVPPSTPKGIIAFCNIAPGLFANFGWSYMLKGKVRYTRRIVGCSLLSFIGMLAVALHESLFSRLMGISLASFSSGIGTVTFLQLSTTYSPAAIGGHCIGYWSSGTGAAGLFGSFLWWKLRGLGVEVGIGISSLFPFVIPLTYFLLLPRPAAFLDPTTSIVYSALPLDDPEIPTIDTSEGSSLLGIAPKAESVFLTTADKWRLLEPMIPKYMLPLSKYTLWRDYYPLWQLVYQTTVFISRSTISIGIPPIPVRLLSLPAVVQLAILITLAYESAFGIFSEDHEGAALHSFLS